MSALRTFFAMAALVVGGTSLMLLAGWQPSRTATDTVPISIRDNPGSYKPSHAAHTGYHRPGGSRTGGVVIVNSRRRTHGGGYSYGK